MIGDLVELNYEIIKLTIIEYMMTSHNEPIKNDKYNSNETGSRQHQFKLKLRWFKIFF